MSGHEKKLAVQHVPSVTARMKGKWLERRSDELCEMARKDPKGLSRAFRTQQSSICQVELAAQLETFSALMRTQPARMHITADELHDCIKR